MKAIGFYIFYAFNWVVTLLPLPFLYLFAGPLYFFMAVWPGYRKNIVLTNLTNAFPGKPENELRSLRKKFYHHLADLFIEMQKMQHMSKSQIMKRYRIKDIGLFESYMSDGKSIIAAFGHYANWEWTTSIQLHTTYKCLTVYKPLANRWFDRHMKKIRSQFGLENIAMADTLRSILKYRKEEIPIAIALISDQTPPRGEIQHWEKFLNQDTAVYTGIEKLAVKYDMPVVFFRIDKVKRGYYELSFESITDNPLDEEPGAITAKHVKRLEEQIIERPELWLWSHRRWKHKRKSG